MKKEIFLLCILLLTFIKAFTQDITFTNPLLPSGADPYSLYRNGNYYYTHTLGNKIALWKTKNLTDLKLAKQTIIWNPIGGQVDLKDIWAPEFHFINGKWYAYFAADKGGNETHRMYVLENSSNDPFKGKWILKGKIAASVDKWAIDGNVFKYRRQLYMIWSGWEGDTNGKQNIYIAKMKNPWTMDSERVMISTPEYAWEKNGDLNDLNNPSHVDVNEGPQFLKNRKNLFIVYSASGCWTDFYTLGLLTFTGKNNLLEARSWKKKNEPVFAKSPENGIYATGHNSFFKSPDGKEDWILYHANSEPGQGCGNKRSPRAQRFYWNEDGSPNFGIPLKLDVPINIPAGNSETL